MAAQHRMRIRRENQLPDWVSIAVPMSIVCALFIVASVPAHLANAGCSAGRVICCALEVRQVLRQRSQRFYQGKKVGETVPGSKGSCQRARPCSAWVERFSVTHRDAYRHVGLYWRLAQLSPSIWPK